MYLSIIYTCMHMHNMYMYKWIPNIEYLEEKRRLNNKHDADEEAQSVFVHVHIFTYIALNPIMIFTSPQ